MLSLVQLFRRSFFFTFLSSVKWPETWRRGTAQKGKRLGRNVYRPYPLSLINSYNEFCCILTCINENLLASLYIWNGLLEVISSTLVAELWRRKYMIPDKSYKLPLFSHSLSWNAVLRVHTLAFVLILLEFSLGAVCVGVCLYVCESEMSVLALLRVPVHTDFDRFDTGTAIMCLAGCNLKSTWFDSRGQGQTVLAEVFITYLTTFSWVQGWYTEVPYGHILPYSFVFFVHSYSISHSTFNNWKRFVK
jgi:hypothetical protein